MLRSMFGMGGTEILVILIVALLFLGPDKLPEAAKQISKGIRDIKKQSRVLQRTIEDDEHIGGAIRDLRSALRGEDEPVRPKPIKSPREVIEVASSPDTPTLALPEPGTPTIAGASTASVIVAAGLETTTGEPTLRGVAAPTPPVEPDAMLVPVPAETRSPGLGGFSGSGSSASSGGSGEETLRGVLAPRPSPEDHEDHDVHAGGDAQAAVPGKPGKLTMPPVAGEPDGAAPTAADDVALAALVKQAPHTIPRSSQPATARAAEPPARSEPTASTESNASSHESHESGSSGDAGESKNG
jgi:sec-independent protein translocase protein TatB